MHHYYTNRFIDSGSASQRTYDEDLEQCVINNLHDPGTCHCIINTLFGNNYCIRSRDLWIGRGSINPKIFSLKKMLKILRPKNSYFHRF